MKAGFPFDFDTATFISFFFLYFPVRLASVTHTPGAQLVPLDAVLKRSLSAIGLYFLRGVGALGESPRMIGIVLGKMIQSGLQKRMSL